MIRHLYLSESENMLAVWLHLVNHGDGIDFNTIIRLSQYYDSLQTCSGEPS
jgi:hypothetical protein